MGEAINLAERRLEPVPQVVELLEDVLARARRGEIRSVAIAAAADARGNATAYTIGDGTLADLHLAASHLQLLLLKHGT